MPENLSTGRVPGSADPSSGPGFRPGGSGKVVSGMTLAMEEFRQLLADRGYRVTAQRLAIYELLQANAQRSYHPSAEELYQQARQRFPMISPATVYNTLELLVQLGLASQLGFPGDVQRYDGNPHAHANVQCVRCKEIFDVDAEPLDDLGKRVAERSDFVILGQRFEFYGICPRCQRAGRREGRPADGHLATAADLEPDAGPVDPGSTGQPSEPRVADGRGTKARTRGHRQGGRHQPPGRRARTSPSAAASGSVAPAPDATDPTQAPHGGRMWPGAGAGRAQS